MKHIYKLLLFFFLFISFQSIKAQCVPFIRADSITNLRCYNDSSGAIRLHINSTHPPFEIFLDSTSSTPLLTTYDTLVRIGHLSAGLHHLIVRDSLGCRDTLSFTLTQSFFDVTIDSIVNYRCYNSINTGSFRINIFSSFPRYSIYINSVTPTLVTGSSTVIRSGLAAGTYRVVVIDSMGCKDSLNVTITAPTRISPVAATVSIPYTGGTGAVYINPSGGTAPFTYAIVGRTPYQPSNYFSGFAVGNYTAVVRDTNGCYDTVRFYIGQNCSVVPFDITDRDSICNNTCATIRSSLPVLRKTTSYTVSSIPYVPLLPCEGPGSVPPGFTLPDDRHSPLVNIGFDFCFFGNTYNQCVISDNGYVTFNAARAGLGSAWSMPATTPIPALAPADWRNAILGPLMDVYIPDGGQITSQTVGVAPWRVFIVNFNDCAFFTNASCPGNRLDSRIILYETTNIIDIYIERKPTCAAWNGGLATEGIQNAAGTVAYTVPGRNRSVWATVNDAWRFTPNGQNIPVNIYWYAVDSPTTVVAVDTTANLCPSLPGPFPTIVKYFAKAVIMDSCTLSATRIDSIVLLDTTSIYVIGAYVTPFERYDSLICSQDSIRLDGGAGGVQYSWIPITLPPNRTQFRWVYNSGDYTCLKFTDIDRCFLDSIAIHVVDKPPLDISVAYLNPVRCRGDSSGYIVMSSLHNTGRVRYALNSGTLAFGDTIKNIWNGNHYIIAEDSFGCRDSLPFTMTENPSIIITLDTLKNLDCYSDSSGRIRVTVTGGATPYMYIWNTYVTTNIIANMPAGIYSLAVIDSNLCSAVDTFTLTQPSPLIVDSILADSTLCYGTNTGAARVFPSGSVPFSSGYHYNWSNGILTYNTTSLNSGNYYVTITDSNACSVIDTIFVPQPNLLAITIPGVLPITCNNGSDGSLILGGTGGTLSYSYSRDGITYSASNLITGLNAGSYTIRIRDAHGCLDDSTYTFSNPLRILPVIAGLTPEACAGANNGTVTISPTNGTPGYRYSLDNILFQVSNTFTGLSQGNYTAYVKDTNNCIDSINFTINRVAPLVLSLDSINVTCNNGQDGSILASIIGGTPNYQYAINSGAYISSNTFSALTQGVYLITVRDTNNCTISDSIRVNQPLRIQPTITTTNITCFGYNNGTVTITPTNGFASFQYRVDGGAYGASSTIGTLTPGIHRAYVRDRFSCVDSIDFTITQPAALVINLITTRNVSCFGGNNGLLRISVSNGTRPYTYNWSNGSTADSAVNLIAGNYYVIVTDSNGCTLSDTFTITQPALLTGTISKVNILCHGANTGTATITASGGTTPYSYLWNDVSAQTTATAINLVAGTYRVTITDRLGCIYIDSITITEPDSLVLSQTHINISCFSGNNGQINGTATGGVLPYQYNIGGAWQASGIFTNLIAGTYTLTVRDFNGCTTNTVITLTQPLRIIPTIITNTPTSCYGGNDGSIVIGYTNGFSPYQYSLNNISYQTANTFSGLVAGNYRAYVQDSLGCIDSINFTITQPASMIIDVVLTHNKCHDDATGIITISPRGGTSPYNYSIDGGTTFVGTNSFSGLLSGVYTIVVSDFKNCTATTTVTLNNPTLLTLDATGVEVQCWDSENGKIFNVASGGTLPYQTYEYSQNGIVYNSNGINANMSNLPAGFYYVKVTDANGCIATDTTTIGRPPIDTFAFTIDSTTCYGAQYLDGSILVTALANPPYTWTIDGGPSQNFGIFYGLGAGNHLIIATNSNGCIDSLIQFVPFPPPVVVDVVPDTVYLTLGGSQQIQVNVQNATNPTYIWNTSQGLSCNDCPNPVVNPYNDMIYTVTVYDHSHPLNASECYGTATLYVMVEEHNKSYVPNAFTPGNGDGINDLLMVYGEGIKKMKFTIYDRWGELLFESDRQDYGWDGTFKGKLLNPGVYIYYVEAEYLDSKREIYQGSATLLK